MEAALTARARQIMAACCPWKKQGPKQRWVSEGGWDLLRGHAAARRCFFARKAGAAKLLRRLWLL
eukprot:5977608-Lingulodinium_polyedra.AAC.1